MASTNSESGSKPTVTNDLYRATARRFESLFDGIPIACFTFDREGTVFEWNRTAEELWELPSAFAMQQPIWKALHRPADDPTLNAILQQVFDGQSVHECEWLTEFEDGRSKWIVANAFPLRSPDGSITGAVLAALDITSRKSLQMQVEAQVLELHEAHIMLEHQRDELAEANAKLEALATTDGLTGLKNHRTFQEFLESQFRIAKRSGASLSMLIMDVDHFKQLNDTHGHPAGDEVLRGLSEVLSELARCSDFVARYGGEEFVVVMPDTSVKGACEAGERFRSAVERTAFPTGPITASFGCATLRPDDRDRSELIARADEALYASKHAGRNRVTHADALRKAA